MKKVVILVAFAFVAVGQAGKWERSLTGSFSTKQGNTDVGSYEVAFVSDYFGDVRLGSVDLKDSEIKISLNHTRARLNDALYQHDGSASFLLDIMANQTFSPFFLSYWAYDSTTTLVKRIQLGAGGKYSLQSGFSISLAYLWEVEDYEEKQETTQFRLSFRPKYKKKFANGIDINYMIFIQPLVNDFFNFLIDNQFTLSIPTLSENLKFILKWRDQYNSQSPKGVEKRDTDINMGIKLLF